MTFKSLMIANMGPRPRQNCLLLEVLKTPKYLQTIYPLTRTEPI